MRRPPTTRRRFASSLAGALVLVLCLLWSGVASAATPLQRHADVVYASPGGVDLHYDAIRPAGPARHPAVVLLHGGGWWSGSRHDLDRARPLAQAFARAGFVAVTVDYRLACGTADAPRRAYGLAYDHALPGAHCGATIADQVADVRAAISDVRSRAGTLRVDPNRIAVLGVSAGGHLALLASLGSDDGSTPVRAVVNVSGPTSTAFVRRQVARPRPPTRTIRAPFTNAVGCAPDVCPQLWRAADPTLALRGGPTPRFGVLAMSGARESQVPAASMQPFVNIARRRGVDAELLAVPGGCHGTGCLYQPRRGTSPSPLAATFAFLRHELR